MGGGQTGGMVVGGPAPWAAQGAGYLQSQAAQAAANAATQQTNNAISLIRQNYTSAYQALKPYTSEGVQALSELNKYMGLGQYNPGTAPVAPEANTRENALKHISSGDINAYVMQNVRPSGPNPSRSGAQFAWEGEQYPTLGKPDANGLITSAGPLSSWGANSPWEQRTGTIKNTLADEYVKNNEQAFLDRTAQYNNEMDIYNQAKALYDANPTPYTPEQVQEKLMAQPGVGFAYNQGLDAIQRAASSKGQIGSGRLLQSLVDYGQGVASQQYGETLGRLAGLVNMGQNSAAQQAQGLQQQGQLTGGMTQQLGDTLANSFLAQGNAMSQALLAANQQYKVIGQQDSGGGLGGIGSLLGGLGSMMGSGGGAAGGGAGLMGLFSSKKLKNKVNTPSTEEILKNVKSLQIDRWEYKGLEGKHLGPYAEEFRDKFGVGDGTSINVIDILGVLMASVQELSKQIDDLKSKEVQ